MLAYCGIASGYTETPVVRGINLAVEKGQVACLIGTNGAGKTTILKTCVGLVHSKEGVITIAGSPLNMTSPADVLAQGVALVPEGRGILAGLSVQENLLVGGYTVRNRSDLTKRLDDVYALFPRLRERSTISGGLLSGGEQQMLAIGRALMCRPTYLLLDEPSMGLSPVLVEFIGELIRSLVDRGIGVLIAEQNAHFALGIADYGYVIEQGEVAFSGTGEELATSDVVRRAYLGWN